MIVTLPGTATPPTPVASVYLDTERQAAGNELCWCVDRPAGGVHSRTGMTMGRVRYWWATEDLARDFADGRR